MIVDSEESHFFISGNGFRDRSRLYWSYEDSPRINPRGNSSLIFLNLDKVNAFFTRYKLTEPFVLLTSNSDDSVTDAYRQIANHPLLIKWYAQNLELVHSKVCPLPLGIVNRKNGTIYTKCGDYSALERVMSSEIAKRQLLHTGFTVHHGRDKVLNEANILPMPLVDFQTYLYQLKESYFSVSPNGLGIDCHRTWESLYLKTIPIVKKSLLTDRWLELRIPLIAVNEWKDLRSMSLTPDLYHQTWGNFDVNQLTCEYFVEEL